MSPGLPPRFSRPATRGGSCRRWRGREVRSLELRAAMSLTRLWAPPTRLARIVEQPGVEVLAPCGDPAVPDLEHRANGHDELPSPKVDAIGPLVHHDVVRRDLVVDLEPPSGHPFEARHE